MKKFLTIAALIVMTVSSEVRAETCSVGMASETTCATLGFSALQYVLGGTLFLKHDIYITNHRNGYGQIFITEEGLVSSVAARQKVLNGSTVCTLTFSAYASDMIFHEERRISFTHPLLGLEGNRDYQSNSGATSFSSIRLNMDRGQYPLAVITGFSCEKTSPISVANLAATLGSTFIVQELNYLAPTAD